MKYLIPILMCIASWCNGQGLTLDHFNQDSITHVVTEKGDFYIIGYDRARVLVKKSKISQELEQVKAHLIQTSSALKYYKNQFEILVKGLKLNKGLLDEMYDSYSDLNNEYFDTIEERDIWKERAEKFKRQRNNRSGILYTVGTVGIIAIIVQIVQNNTQ